MTSTSTLARWCSDLSIADLNDADVERLQTLLADHLGVARLGATRPHHRVWTSLEQELGGPGEGASSVVGHPTLMGPDRAAFLNGVAGSSGPNLDDVWHGSLGHPGVGTWPAALAVGEDVDADGTAVLLAGAVGYEVAMRVGSAVGRSAFERGWHPRGGCNTVSAAVAALKVQGESDPATYAAAIGLAANAAAGVVGASYFADAWYALSGQSSREGVLAAAAARRGLSATTEPLTGPRGYLAATSDEPDEGALTNGLGCDSLMLHQAGQKLYPSSGATHAALEAARVASVELDTTPDKVDTVTIVGFREMVGVLGRPFPSTALAATMSTPYVAACALRDGTFNLSHLEQSQLDHPVLLTLQERITLRVDRRLDALPPRHLGARATVTTTDGRSATAEVLSASGHPGNPLRIPDITKKLRGLHADNKTLQFDVDALIRGCVGLRDGDVRGLMRLVRV